jgi:hypothetical protein
MSMACWLSIPASRLHRYNSVLIAKCPMLSLMSGPKRISTSGRKARIKNTSGRASGIIRNTKVSRKRAGNPPLYISSAGRRIKRANRPSPLLNLSGIRRGNHSHPFSDQLALTLFIFLVRFKISICSRQL